MDGINSLSDENIESSEYRNEPSRAGVQPEAGDVDLGPSSADRSDTRLGVSIYPKFVNFKQGW